MNTIREVQRINQQELERGIAGTSASWHAQYAQSAWIYVGNLDHALTEGDILCVLSQYGEMEDLHLVRDETTGKSKGFGFAKYEDARSCVLAVDNFCGVQLCGRSLRVDHVENYRLPKHLLEKQQEKASPALTKPGLAYQDQELANEYTLEKGQDLFAGPPPPKQPDLAKKKGGKDESNRQRRKEEKQAKRERKEERQQKRLEKEKKRQEKEERRMEREERRRLKRAQKMSSRGEDNVDDPSGDEKSSKKRKHDHPRDKEEDRHRRHGRREQSSDGRNRDGHDKSAKKKKKELRR